MTDRRMQALELLIDELKDQADQMRSGTLPGGTNVSREWWVPTIQALAEAVAALAKVT